MLKRIIKYTDYNGNPRTQEFYFYLNNKNLQELDALYQEDGGFAGRFNLIINNLDKRKLLETFEDITVRAYGVKSEDGTKFVKSKQVQEDFLYSAAYEQLFNELTMGDDASAKLSDFLKKILPAELQGQIEKADAEGTNKMSEILAEAIKDQEAAAKNAAENK